MGDSTWGLMREQGPPIPGACPGMAGAEAVTDLSLQSSCPVLE